MGNIQVNTHIHLESITLSMAPIIFNAIDQDRKYLRKWLPFVDLTRSVSDTELFIKSMLNQKVNKKDEMYAIWFDMNFAGLIGFKDTDWVNNKTELGYWLVDKMQGKGIITSSTTSLVAYAFRKLRVNRIQIKVAKGNAKSAAIPVRLGFQLEGIERHGELLNGEYYDLEVFSLLKSDYFKTD